MRFNIKDRVSAFLNSSKDYPILVGFLPGFYSVVFYCSNNYESVNSYQHLLYFSLVFLLAPMLAVCVLYKIFVSYKRLQPYAKHLLFVLVIEMFFVFLSQVYYLTIKKKLLLGLFLVLCFLSFKFFKVYKKILLFTVLLSLIPLYQCAYIFIYKQFVDTTAWTKQPDAIESVKFKKKPNIYFIEPDGYVGEKVMTKLPYNCKSEIYSWLRSKSFTVYDNTRSNYPVTLVSNASMFAMKHHYLKSIITPNLDMLPDTRSIIVGNNPVINVLKNNDYKTFFIVDNAYFQQNFQKRNYDFYNINNSEISFFHSFHDNKKNVYEDLKKHIEMSKNLNQPKFFFIEKLLPHHVFFNGNKDKEITRKIYLKNILLANIWIKKTVDLIIKNDPHGIIIIAADHGGYVGLLSDNDMYTTKEERLLKSVFSNLVAVKWNDNLHSDYDEKFKSNVNFFRVLFSFLSEDKSLLNYLQPDTSYNFYDVNNSNKVYMAIDENGSSDFLRRKD